MTTQDQLNDLLSYLKANHPLLKGTRILYNFEDEKILHLANHPFGPTYSDETPGYFFPMVRSRKLNYDGYLCVAIHHELAFNTLVHEYRHALQCSQGLWTEAGRWDMEIDAIKFARTTLAEYQAQLPVAKSKPQNLKKAA